MLETARGGIVLRGVGYESNDASVLTNVSSDHLDLQGIHTLPELAEVKATDLPDHEAGWLGRAQCRRSARRGGCPAGTRQGRLLHPRWPRRPRTVRRHRARGGRAYLVRRRRWWSRPTATTTTEIVAVARGPDHDRRAGPAQRRQCAGGGRRRARAWAPRSPQVARRAASTSRPTPSGRRDGSTCSASGQRVVIVDFAHNEAGIAAILDVAEGIAAGAAAPDGADHRDHRHGRRPARRHAAGHRPDRRQPAPSGS